MPTPDPLARELLERELAEAPDARAARTAHGRWITQRRVWAAIDRQGISEPDEQARFLCASLWPDLRAEIVDAFAAAVRRSTLAGRPLLRPTKPRDVVGEPLERLLIAHGYLAHGGGDDDR